MNTRELSQQEVELVNGGNPVVYFVGGAIVGGLIYDGVKAGVQWWGETFLARDGSGGSRYPISELENR